jgi:hypothetical protein
MNYAPIAFFVFDRPEHTKISLESLKNNDLAKYSDIIFFSDGPKKDERSILRVKKVRKIINEIKGFKSIHIIERKSNIGLYNNFVKGITEICNKYGSVIILEDDNQVSKHFLNYMNDGLTLYKDEKKVCSINGWFFPGKNNLEETFLLKGGDTWGWATWKRAWSEFNPDTDYLLKEIKNKNLIKEFNLNDNFEYYKQLEKRNINLNNSHTIIWKASTFLKNMYSLYPAKSFVKNIGFDPSGTHYKGYDKKHEHNHIENYSILLKKIKVEESKKALRFVEKFYKKHKIIDFINNIKKRLFNFRPF